MPDNICVSLASSASPTVYATFSDELNHSFVVVGGLNAAYYLDNLASSSYAALAAATAAFSLQMPPVKYSVTKTVAASGGDYTSPATALTAITDAALTKRYRLNIATGTFAQAEFMDVDYVDLLGTSSQDCIIDGSQPNNSSAFNLSTYSTMYFNHSTKLEGLTIKIKNGRYAIHADSSNVLKNRYQEIVNCYIAHLGNDDAPNNTWSSQCALGMGMSSGGVFRSRGAKYYSKNSCAVFYHTNALFSDPCLVDFEGCSFITDYSADTYVLLVSPLGSFQPDQCRLVGNVIGGDINYAPTNWQATGLANQPAYHAEINMWGHGNSPAVFYNNDFGVALRITSASAGANSSIVIGGTAVPALFGDGASAKSYTVAGSAGFKGYVYGWGDISGVVAGTTLGARLGDCTSVNKTLTVVVDGGGTLTVTFASNYTAISNATVIAAINTVLGSAALCDTWQPGQRYRPRFTDEEQTLLNTSVTGIPFGSVVAYNSDSRAVRVMTSSDAASLFVGIAWEDIPAGKSGRIKTRGSLILTDILRADATAVAFGDTFSISDTYPGQIVHGGSLGILSAIRSTAVKVS